MVNSKIISRSLLMFIFMLFLFLARLLWLLLSCSRFSDDVHLTDDFVECFQLREICLFGSDTYRSETILQAVQILIFIDDEQSVEAGCLEEDDLAL
jgi:hypothetical protein